MANSKITGLPAASALTGTEPLAVVQGGVTKQTTAASITTAVAASVTAVSASVNPYIINRGPVVASGDVSGATDTANIQAAILSAANAAGSSTSYSSKVGN